MKFKELDIQSQYNSFHNNVYSNFFNEVLPHCYTYKRFGGIFSGEKFVQFAFGLKDFIHKNEGKMELIIIPDIDQEDISAFKRDTIKKAIDEKWLNDLSKINDEFSKNHIKALAGLIAQKRLVIKLILPKKDSETYFSKNELENIPGILEEVGIFENIDDNEFISINGQVSKEPNKKTWFTVSRYWEEDEVEKLNKNYRLFFDIWETDYGKEVEINGIKFEVRQLSDEIIDFFNQESQGVELQKIELDPPPPEPRDYQVEAISGWISNGKRGMLEMATGTGKTFTAVESLRRILDEENLFVVVTAPYDHLVKQWNDEFKNFNIETLMLKEDWRTGLSSSLTIAKNKKLTVVLCTHNKFSHDDFINKIKIFDDIKKLVIVDEVHHLGAGIIYNEEGEIDERFEFNSRNGLIEKYDYRLGLSATIDRYFDDGGTKFLDSYFQGNEKSRVIKYGMDKAIEEGFLCKYDYHPTSVKLTDNELKEYKEITIQAVRCLNSKIEKTQRKGKFLIMINRARIIRDAENKFLNLKEILKKIKNPNHLLIFASEKQIPIIRDMLLDAKNTIGIENPTFAEITHKNPKNQKDRLPILRDFQKGRIQIIIANKVLDEGLNIPEARICIIMASTGNPTQFIQRRGRILRPYSGVYEDGTIKTSAVVYDVLVKPEIENLEEPELIKTEINLIRNQLDKIELMADLARNKKRTDEIEKFLIDFKSNIPEELFHS